MKRFLLSSFLIASLTLNSFAQTKDNFTKTLSRLLIKNEKNELLVIKVEQGFWVTPALYNKHGKNIKESLNDFAKDYGVVLGDLQLKGMFYLDIEFTKSSCFRLFFETKIKSGNLVKPDNIVEMKWVSEEEAIKMMDFEHISLGLKKIVDDPNKLWGGSFLFYKENGILKSKQTEDFYPLK